jgi:hypothetical protein
MARIAETFNIGDKKDLTVEKLVELIEILYTDLAVAINKKPDVIERAADGQTTDTFLSNGDININTSTLKVEILTSHSSSTAVTWSQID